MTTEETVLVRYTVELDPKISSEEFRVSARLALAQLLTVFANELLHNTDIDLAIDHEIELTSVTERWDQKLKLRLIRKVVE